MSEPEPKPEPKNISDKLKQTIDELDIDRHVNEFVMEVESVFTMARDKIATLAAERGDEVERLLDKVGTTIDERTEGRYASQVDKVRETVLGGVSKLAEQRPADTGPVWPVDEIETAPTPNDPPADDPTDPLDPPGTGS